MPPKVTVLMTVYNGQDFLAGAIECVLAQTFTDFELLIVDDGSDDRSADIIRSWARSDERIRKIKHERNMGVAQARNSGLAAAAGQYVAYQDSDDLSRPRRLQMQLDYLESHPQVGALGCQMEVVDQDLKPLFDYATPPNHALITWNLFFGWGMAHCASMLRRRLYDARQPYNPRNRYAEDLELWLRLAPVTRFANLPEKLVRYRSHDQSVSVKRRDLQKDDVRMAVAGALNALWGDAPADTLERFMRLRSRARDFGRADRVLLQAELTRLIEALITHGWVDAGDRALLEDEMARRLRESEPVGWRRWLRW